MSLRNVTRVLFFATLFCVTFEKIQWSVGGSIALVDVLAFLFLVSFAVESISTRRPRMPRASAIALAFAAIFLLVYLVGYFNLDTSQAVSQYWKGMIKFALHFLFLIAGVTYLVRRTERFFWQSLGVFVAGMVVNGAYGVLQLLTARSGVNLDQIVLSPITGGASNINIYGREEGGTQAIFRTNALTGDPNHLGVFLVIPLLVLLPLYVRLEKGHRWRLPVGLTVAFLALVEIATLSRSGLLGLLVGGLILVFPYRRFVASRALLIPVGVVVVILGAIVLTRLSYFHTIVASRFQTSGANGTSAHFGVYGFIPDVVSQHPLFGLGLNNFSVYYELVTGKTNWGPHSFYVALIVETGLIGTMVFAAFLWYVFNRLHAVRAVGRALARLGDTSAARVRPLGWGMTAALAGTMASNIFYLTMSFYYFFAFVTLALAAPVVFGRRLRAAA